MNESIYSLVYKVTHAAGSGTCFYLKDYDLFVTNYHVVEGFHNVAIHDKDRNVYLGKVILVNPETDLALIVADGDFSHLPSLLLSDSANLNIGHKVYVAGYPFGMPFTMTEGSVSAPKQLIDGRFYVQTDAAVNPGNSGGPIFNKAGELIAITVSKFTDADNMGFGIQVDTLKQLLENIADIDRTEYNVQCGSCEEFISEATEYCPSCGEKLIEEIFEEREISPISYFCEEALEKMGINPISARAGNEVWRFHKGSSEIRLFVYEHDYLFAVSPIVLLPKKNIEAVLRFVLSNEFSPYKLGVDGREVYIAYRIHLADITNDLGEEIQQHIIKLSEKADELDNYMVDKFGCEFSEFSKVENEN